MSLITDLPAIFDQFSEARQKGFLTVMDLKEQGILVGTCAPSCAGDPDGGGWWWSRCSTSMKPSEAAEKDQPRKPLPADRKSSYGFGKTDKCPYFTFPTW